MRRTESRPRDYIPEDKLKELERKRKQWKKEQELLRQHEKRKAKMIAEYEERRARELGLKKRRRTSRSRSPSRSRSRTRPSSRKSRATSPSRSRSRDRTRISRISSSSSGSVRIPVMSEKCDASTSNTPLFKGREGKKIDTIELQKVKVTIQRDIASSSEDNRKEILRDITDPDEIVIKRREGEGSKPIFEREELEQADKSTSDVAERRTVVAVESIKGTDGRRAPNRRLRSQSSERYASHTLRRSARYENAREADSRRSGVPHKRNESTASTRYPFHQRIYPSDNSFGGSLSRARGSCYQVPVNPGDTEYSFAGQPSIDGLRYRRNDALPYHESMAFPMYYDNFARPMMMDPMTMRTRMPLIMNPYRGPPRPQLMPPEPYRFNFAQSQRYNRRF